MPITFPPLLHMASSAFSLLSPPNAGLLHCHPSRQKPPVTGVPSPRCSFSSEANPVTTSSDDGEDLPELPPSAATTSFAIEKRVKSTIVRDPRRTPAIERLEPPNFEIGWKRTKEIKLEKPKGWAIADVLEKLEGLIARRRYGSADLLATAGTVVAERAREEAEVLMAGGEVEERMVTELGRVLRLMEMDLVMVKAAVKEETLEERLEQARARCRQAILVALSF